MSKRILIIYASRNSSTAETADMIGHELSMQQENTIEVVSVKRAKYVTTFDSIILGTAIRMGRPLPEMTSFVKSYKPILANKKVALFGLCMALKDPTAENIKTSLTYLDPLRAHITPVETHLFAGKVNLTRLGFAFRMILKMAKTPEGDFRKFDEIKAWAEELSQKL